MGWRQTAWGSLAHTTEIGQRPLPRGQGLCVLREWEAEEGKEGIGVTAVVA